MSEPTTYKTADLYVAAFLTAMGEALSSVEKNKRQALFVFEPSAALSSHVESWITGKALVRATAFTAEIKRLKGLVHAQ